MQKVIGDVLTVQEIEVKAAPADIEAGWTDGAPGPVHHSGKDVAPAAQEGTQPAGYGAGQQPQGARPGRAGLRGRTGNGGLLDRRSELLEQAAAHVPGQGAAELGDAAGQVRASAGAQGASGQVFLARPPTKP